MTNILARNRIKKLEREWPRSEELMKTFQRQTKMKKGRGLSIFYLAEYTENPKPNGSYIGTIGTIIIMIA